MDLSFANPQRVGMFVHSLVTMSVISPKVGDWQSTCHSKFVMMLCRICQPMSGECLGMHCSGLIWLEIFTIVGVTTMVTQFGCAQWIEFGH